MIVQCKSCQTKFKFDETLIEGEGVWGRCSKCKDMFFIDNPLKLKTVSLPEDEKEMAGISSEPGRVIEHDIKNPKEDIKQPESEPVGALEKEVGDIDKINVTGFDKTKTGEPYDNEDKVQEKKGKKRQTPTRGRQLVYLFIVLLLGGVYLTYFAETGKQVLFEKFLGTGQKSEEVGPAQVDLTDIKQRLVNNLNIGTIRVVQGTASNQSLFPMTRIKIKGEITDAYTVVLRVLEVYCGNLLTDDELATMTEDQIQKELSNPQGSDVSNDRIEPKGQIPFMIVFTREPPGVVKAFVTPAGAERLLP